MHYFNQPPIKPKDEDIFIDDVNLLVKKSYPNYENQHPLFKKFGVRAGGICDTWLYTKNWEQLEEIDKWKYVALCALYWKEQYKYWNEQEEYEQYKNYLKEQSNRNPAFLTTLHKLEEKENMNDSRSNF